MNFIEKGPEILSEALENGGDFSEIFFEERTSTSFRCEDRKVDRIICGTDRGAGIRVVVGDRTVYGHTNDATLQGLRNLAKRAAQGINASRGSVDAQLSANKFSAAVAVLPEKAALGDKVDKVMAADDAAWSVDSRIQQATVRYGDSHQRLIIMNSLGAYCEEERVHILLAVQVVARSGDVIQTGYEAAGGTLGWEFFRETDPAEVARKAARQAIVMLEADKAPMGVMPVVLSSEAGGTMVHEAVGHGLEADYILKGLSKYSGRIGRQIASPLVTVVDDATLPKRRGSGHVDDEGTPCQRTVLIDSGVLKGFMHDLITARKGDFPPSGNGRRESYRHKPIPRMTNTLILPGSAKPQDVLAATESGLFVKKMGGGQVNPINGDFMFEVSEGYAIKAGRIASPVRGACMTGNAPDVLMKIDMVADDLGFGLGTCGKEGQGVPVADAQPTLRISALTIGGTQV